MIDRSRAWRRKTERRTDVHDRHLKEVLQEFKAHETPNAHPSERPHRPGKLTAYQQNRQTEAMRQQLGDSDID